MSDTTPYTTKAEVRGLSESPIGECSFVIECGTPGAMYASWCKVACGRPNRGTTPIDAMPPRFGDAA